MKRVKTIVVIFCVSILLVNACSCQSQNRSISSSENASSSETTTATMTVETVTQASDEKASSESVQPTPTGFEKYIGETLPTVEFENPSGFPIFGAYRIACGGLEFGFDNHKYLDNIRQYYNDNSLYFYDLGYLQEYLSHRDMLRYSPHRDDVDREFFNFQRQVSLYILYKLDCRLYVDEIPDEFFDTNFDDYLKELENTGDPNYDAKTGTEVFYDSLRETQFQTLFKSKNVDEFISGIDEVDQEQLSKLLVFFSSYRYNQKRCSLVYDYHTISDGDNYTASYITQVRTATGKNVLLFKQYQYDAFLNDVHDQACYKEIGDLYKPITEQDLIDAGIDMDKFKYIIEDLAGITFDIG